MTSTTAPLQLATTHLRLRGDASIEPLVVDAGFWGRVASGQLGNFHHEYLVTTHTYAEKWPMWEMHPHGDEVVLLICGAVDVRLEEAAGARTVSLRAPGDCVLVPQGAWHTATPLALSTLLFITAGEGTQHRPAS